MRLRLCILALLSILQAQGAHADPPGAKLRSAGDAKVAWAWQRVSGTQAEYRLVIAYTDAKDADPRFLPLPMHPTSAEVPIAAVRDGYLHVFFNDGTHYRMRTPTIYDRRDPNAKFDYPEVHLPDKRVPVALAGDSAGNALYALVPHTTAVRILENAAANAEIDGKAPAADADVDTNATATPSPSPSPSPAPDFTVSKWALVRYVPDDWSALAPLPESADDHTRIWLTVSAGAPQVFFASADDPDTLHHLRYDGETWNTLPDVAEVPASRVLVALGYDDAVVLVAAEPVEGQTVPQLVPHVRKDGVWQRGEPLAVDGQPLQVQANNVAVTRLGDGLLALWPAGEGEDAGLRAARWEITGGNAKSRVVPAVALQGAAGAVEEERTRFLITLAAMTLIVLIVMRARRESFVTDLPVPPGYVLARLGPRALAFFLDAAAVTLIVVPLLFVPWFADHGVTLDERLQERFELAYSQDANGVYWRWLVGTLIFALYCIAFEATLGATPGKLAMRLKVCNNRAERASFGAVVVRNLLRFEIYPVFHFFPIVVLVLFTRNRQRLGDLAGNTLVVEKAGLLGPEEKQ